MKINLKESIKTHFPFDDSPHKYSLFFAALGIFFVPVSTSGMQTFLGVAGILWIYTILRKTREFRWHTVFYFLLVFALLSGISIIFSLDPAASMKLLKKIPIIIVPLYFYNVIIKKEYICAFLKALIAGALLNSFSGFIFYFTGRQHRLSGFQGHYMTFAGILMLIIIFLLARMLISGLAEFGFRKTLILLIFCGALLLTLTRNAWVGAFLGLILLFAFIRPRYVPLGIVLILLGFLIVPTAVQQRIASTFDLQDETIKDRIRMIEIGREIIDDYPVTGVGPEMVKRVYLEYQTQINKKPMPHLHNNFIQIAAERGLLTLFAWIAFLSALVFYLWRIYIYHRRENDEKGSYLAIGAIIAIIAFLVAGLFEYNWGDTEVELAFLFLVSLPLSLYKPEMDDLRL